MKNSTTPTIPRGLRSGKPNAAWRPERRAASARGKFRSVGVSTIHAGSAGQQDAAGEALARLEREPLAERLELRRPFARVPGAHAAQAPILRAGLPDRTELPPQRPSDRFERRRVDLDRRLGFSEDLRDLVLDALQDLRVNYDCHGQR